MKFFTNILLFAAPPRSRSPYLSQHLSTRRGRRARRQTILLRPMWLHLLHIRPGHSGPQLRLQLLPSGQPGWQLHVPAYVQQL